MGSALDRLNKLGIKDYAPGEIGIKTPQPTKAAITPVVKQVSMPGNIQALGAGDYGASKQTRLNSVVNAGVKSTQSSLANIRGQLLAPTGELSIGQNAQAAVHGISQQTAEAEKTASQRKYQAKAYALADNLAKQSAEDTAKAKEGLGKVGRTLVDVGVAGTQMLGDLAANAILPGSGLAAMGARSYGQSSQQARQSGANEIQQVGYGAAAATVEALTEKLFDGLAGLYGGGAADDVVEKVIGKIAKSSKGMTALRALANFSGEGLEEIVSDAVNPIIRSIYDGKSVGENYSQEKVADWLHDGLVGGFLGLAGAGTQVITGQNTQKNAEARAANGYASFKPMTEAEQAAHDKVLALNPQPAEQTASPDIVKILAGTNVQPKAAEQATAQGNEITPPQEQNAPTAKQDAPTEIVQPNPAINAPVEPNGLHIDDRSYSDVSSRKVKAFQYDHPELHPYFVEAAKGLQQMLGSSTKGERFSVRDEDGYITGSTGASRNVTPEIEKLLDDAGLSYAQIGKALDDLIHDHGQENYAAAKKVELALDDMLTSGFEIEGYDIPANTEYINAKNALKGNGGLDGYSMTEEEWNSLMSQGDGLGAADKGFATTPYTEWQNATDEGGFHPISDTAAQNVVEQQSRAPMEIPKQDPNGGLTSKQVSTIVNSGITPDDFASALANDAATGKFSHMAYSDAEAVHKVEQNILGKSWDEAYTEYKDAVKDGKVSKDISTTGIVLYNNAVTSGDYAKAMDIASMMIGNSTNVGQAMQAMNLLNKLSPEGKLYMAQKAIDDISERVKAANENTPKTRKARKQSQEAADETEDAIAEVAGAIAKGITRKGGVRKAKTTIEGNMVGEPFTFEYVDQIGEAVGRAVKARATSKPKAKTFADNIISELKAFANETVPKPTTKGHTLTATERIADYIANKDAYSEAWSRAQDYLRDKYSGDPEMLSALESFTNSTIGFRGTPLSSDQIMLKALAESAIKSGEVGKTLRAQNALGMTGMHTIVADKLIQATGATGTDAEIIRSAAYDAMQSSISQIEGKMESAGQTQETVIQSEVNSIMRDIGLTLSQTAAMDGGKKSTVAEAVSVMLANKYGFGEMDTSNVADTVQDVFAKMVDEAATKRLTSMFGEKSAPQIREYMDRVNELVNLGAFEKSQFAAAASEKLFGYKDITVDPDLMKAYKEALDSDDETAAQKAWVDIEKSVADQIPSSWVEKANAWRYLAMLGNPRTHVRNIVGNAGFMPVRMMKNTIASGIERVTIGKAGEGSGRTKAALNLASAEDRQLLQAGWNEYADVEGLIQSGGKFNDTPSEIEGMRTIFKGKGLEAVRTFNNKALDVEDTWFSRPAYAESLAGYLKANGVSAKDYMEGNISAEVKTAAQEYAVKEAQKATYRDYNDFSDFVSRLGKNYNGKNGVAQAANTLIEGVLPFKRTPANILVRGVEYSPLEFVRVIGSDIKQVKAGNMAASDMIDHISSGLTGTALLGLGVLLASQGVISGGSSGDDKQDKFNTMQGAQNYALSLGDKNYTLDWLAPEALPLFVGVEIYNSAANNGDLQAKDLYKAFTRVAQPVVEMSMLSGVNDMIDNVSYAESSDKLWAIAASAATSYLSQYIPTIGGQAERTIEDTRQTTFTDRNSAIPSDIQYAIGKAANKIPGVDYNQINYIDAWGRKTDTGSTAGKIANNFFNPAYVSKNNTTAVDKELQRLYDAGQTNVLPQRAATSVKVNDEYLTGDEYEQYQTTKGQTSYDILRKAVSTFDYKNMTDEQKAKAVAGAYEYSTYKANRQIAAQRGETSKDSEWDKYADAEKNGVDFWTMWKIKHPEDKNGNGRADQKEQKAALNALAGLTPTQKTYIRNSIK